MNHSGAWERITEIAMAISGFFVGLYGGWSAALSILVVFMAADYILGIACALAKKSAKTEGGGFLSKVAFVGLLKKGVIMLVVLLAVQLDKAIAGDNPANLARTFETAATFFYIANEGLSIIENAALLGVPVPKVVKTALEVLRDKHDDSGQGGGQGDKGGGQI